MKTSIKIALLVIIALIVIAASRSGEPPQGVTVDPAKGCYSQEDIQLLMEFNGWSKQEAVQALELSCQYAVTPK